MWYCWISYSNNFKHIHLHPQVSRGLERPYSLKSFSCIGEVMPSKARKSRSSSKPDTEMRHIPALFHGENLPILAIWIWNAQGNADAFMIHMLLLPIQLLRSWRWGMKFQRCNPDQACESFAGCVHLGLWKAALWGLWPKGGFKLLQPHADSDVKPNTLTDASEQQLFCESTEIKTVAKSCEVMRSLVSAPDKGDCSRLAEFVFLASWCPVCWTELFFVFLCHSFQMMPPTQMALL